MPAPGTFHDEAEEAADADARDHVERAASGEAEPPREHVHGITREQWAYWHSHPVTRLMREYLRDRVERLGQEAMETWLIGRLVLADEHALRNRIVQIAEIEKLGFDDVRQFYEEPKE